MRAAHAATEGQKTNTFMKSRSLTFCTLHVPASHGVDCEIRRLLKTTIHNASNILLGKVAGFISTGASIGRLVT